MRRSLSATKAVDSPASGRACVDSKRKILKSETTVAGSRLFARTLVWAENESADARAGWDGIAGEWSGTVAVWQWQ
jgi:hypothetical protein